MGGVSIDGSVVNQGGVPLVFAAALADFPPAGVRYRIGFRTDSPYGIYMDTGSAFVLIAENSLPGNFISNNFPTNTLQPDSMLNVDQARATEIVTSLIKAIAPITGLTFEDFQSINFGGTLFSTGSLYFPDPGDGQPGGIKMAPSTTLGAVNAGYITILPYVVDGSICFTNLDGENFRIVWATTGNRVLTVPDASGTIALTGDIPSITGLVPYTGATGAVNLGSNAITAGGATITAALLLQYAAAILSIFDSTGYATRVGAAINFNGTYDVTNGPAVFAKVIGYKENLIDTNFLGAYKIQVSNAINVLIDAAIFDSGQGVTLPGLAGSGDRLVYVNSAGKMIQAIIGSGLSLSAGTLTATGGGAGTVTATGMGAGYITKANSATDIGNSIMQDNGSTISVGGALTASGVVTGSSFTGAGTGLTGTAAALSIGGNAATATLAATATNANNASLAANSTTWNGQVYALSSAGTLSQVLMYNSTAVQWQARTAADMQAFLGLGSNAYTSTAFAPLASPALTGTPTAPTPAANDSSIKIATTAYVDAADALKAPLASPALTGNPTAPTQTAGNNSTRIATTAYVDAADALKAPLASPALTGTPTAPTAAAADNSTKIATTAYVDAADALKAPLVSPALTGNPTAPTQTAGNNSTRIATTAYVDAADALKAPLASPNLTGTPTAPTPAADDNSTKIATTAYVDGKFTGYGGEFAYTGAATVTLTVTFGFTVPGNYAVCVTPSNLAAASQPCYITNKTSTTFQIILISPNTDVSFDWIIAPAASV